MSDLLARIDAATAGLCQCGAAPREGSTYCGPDCEPTHIGVHTTSGTAMRWRPDLVTEADDMDLVPLGSESHGYTGRFNAQVFERISAPETWHLRLDDGHRFIGVDVDNVGGRQDPISVDLVGRVREAWRRLERELTDPAHAVPNCVIENESWAGWTDGGCVDESEDPWADVMPAVAFHRAAPCIVRPSDHNPIVRAQILAIQERIAAAVMPSAPDLQAAGRAVAQSIESMAPAAEAFLREVGFALTEWQRSMVEQMCRSTQVVRPRMAGRTSQLLPDEVWAAAIHRSALPAERLEVAGYRPAADPDEPPTDPMQRALWLRKRRNTGPAPDRLDGRRRRRR